MKQDKTNVIRCLEETWSDAVESFKKFFPNISLQFKGKDEHLKIIAGFSPEKLKNIILIINKVFNSFDNIENVKKAYTDISPAPHYDVTIDLSHCFFLLPYLYNHPQSLESLYHDTAKKDNKVTWSALTICYLITYKLIAERYSLYIKPQDRDAYLLRWGKLIEVHPATREEVEKILRKFSESAAYKYNKILRGSKKRSEELYSLVFQVVTEMFSVKINKQRVPLSMEEGLIKVAKEGVSNISIAVKNKLIDEYRRYDKKKGLPFVEEDNRSEEFQSIESIPDIPKLREVERTSNLVKWMESIKDPQNQEIVRLSFMKGLRVRKIAAKLGLSKSDVDRRIQKLKKLKPPF